MGIEVSHVAFFGVVLVVDIRFAVFRAVASQQLVLHCTLVVRFLGHLFFSKVSYLRLLYRPG